MKASEIIKQYKSSNVCCCPVCSAAMKEIARLSDKGSALVWYRCSHDSCSGRWMQEEYNLSLQETFSNA